MMDDEPPLLRQMARREQSAWAIMYDRHVGDVFGVVYHLLGRDWRAAEDICQEVWLLAIERFDLFDSSRGEFRTWLLGIARHRVFHHHRRLAPRSAGACLDGPADGSCPLDLLEEAERADVVRAALLCLNPDHRSALLAKYVDGCSVAEIATRTGRSAKAVESLLSRARVQLRELLGPYFPGLTETDKREPADVPKP
jgi:RNA polymerase sigma-70 factor (ECF subfamily)